MIIREIKGYEHEVHIGESVIKEVLKEELSNEAMDFVARIEETANDLLDGRYTDEEVEKESVKFAQDILTEMYNHISCNPMKRDDILKYFNEMYKKLEGQLNE
jgi:hypothetical protein